MSTRPDFHDSSDENVSRENLARARVGPPPFLEARLQGWGKVVAYRAAILARPREDRGWKEKARGKIRRMATRKGNDAAQPAKYLVPTPLDLAKNWRLTEKASGEWPTGGSSDSRGRRGSPSDVRGIQSAYWDIVGALDGRRVLIHDGDDPFGKPILRFSLKMVDGCIVADRSGWASTRTQMALTWLYAVPHYGGEQTTIEGLVSARSGHLSGEKQRREVIELEDGLSRWYASACRMLGIHRPRDPLCLEDLVPPRMGHFYSSVRVCPHCYDQVLSSIRLGLRCSIEPLSLERLLMAPSMGVGAEMDEVEETKEPYTLLAIRERNVLYDGGLLVLIRSRGGFCVCR